MLLPNNKGMLSKRAGYNKAGEASFGPGLTVRCAVVKLIHEIKKTPIRTDASASRGRADEPVSVSTILFLPATRIEIGDRFAIAGLDLRCSGAEPRFDAGGKLDHIECTFEAWGAP